MREPNQEVRELEAELAALKRKHAVAIPGYDVTRTVQKNQSLSVSVVNKIASDMSLRHNKTKLVTPKTYTSAVENENNPSSVKSTSIREVLSVTNGSTRARSETDEKPRAI